MSAYAIGDIHGCYEHLLRLQAKLDLKAERDRVFLLGDLGGRGPQSIEVFTWAWQRSDWVSVILGNHDLALLMAYAGLRATDDAGLQRVLESAHADEICTWLRSQPLLVREQGYVMVHAGILPAWTLERACAHARIVELGLQGPDWQQFLQKCWGNQQRCDDPNAGPEEQAQLAVNALTRMRMCDQAGCIDLSYGGKPDEQFDPELAWYVHSARQWAGPPIICGHWSGLGLYLTEDVIMLDAGCVHDGPLCTWDLTAKRLIVSA